MKLNTIEKALMNNPYALPSSAATKRRYWNDSAEPSTVAPFSRSGARPMPMTSSPMMS